jgi:hypothetical protein
MKLFKEWLEGRIDLPTQDEQYEELLRQLKVQKGHTKFELKIPDHWVQDGDLISSDFPPFPLNQVLKDFELLEMAEIEGEVQDFKLIHRAKKYGTQGDVVLISFRVYNPADYDEPRPGSFPRPGIR